MLAISRDAKALSQQVGTMMDNLQKKYENLDLLLVSRSEHAQLIERIDKMETDLLQKIEECGYGDEDDSQNADSIEDIKNSDLKEEEKEKSRKSFQRLQSNIQLVQPDDVKSFGSEKRRKAIAAEAAAANSSQDQYLSPTIQQESTVKKSAMKPIMEVVTTVQDPQGQQSQIRGVTI